MALDVSRNDNLGFVGVRSYDEVFYHRVRVVRAVLRP